MASLHGSGHKDQDEPCHVEAGPRGLLARILYSPATLHGSYRPLHTLIVKLTADWVDCPHPAFGRYLVSFSMICLSQHGFPVSSCVPPFPPDHGSLTMNITLCCHCWMTWPYFSATISCFSYFASSPLFSEVFRHKKSQGNIVGWPGS